MAATALVQHAPWGGDGGAEETQYGARCIDNLIRAPDGTPLSPDVLMFNWGGVPTPLTLASLVSRHFLMSPSAPVL